MSVSSGSDLPELHEGMLDGAGLDAYVADLSACAQVLEVRLKATSTEYSDDAAPDLTESLARLRAGRVRAVQIRYRFEHELWCDTLVGLARGIRIVRSRVPTLPPA